MNGKIKENNLDEVKSTHGIKETIFTKFQVSYFFWLAGDLIHRGLRWFPSIALRIRSAHNTGQLAIFKNGDLLCVKLARKKNGHFQSTAVKSRTENLLDSRKRKSSDSLAD